MAEWLVPGRSAGGELRSAMCRRSLGGPGWGFHSCQGNQVAGLAAHRLPIGNSAALLVERVVLARICPGLGIGRVAAEDVRAACVEGAAQGVELREARGCLALAAARCRRLCSRCGGEMDVIVRVEDGLEAIVVDLLGGHAEGTAVRISDT